MTEKSNQGLKIAGWILLGYGAIEAVDTLTVALAGLELISLPYPDWAFSHPMIRSLMAESPLWFAPLFAFITCFRLAAGIGLLKNRAWGFWAAVFISLVTVIWIPLLLPLSALDALLLIPVGLGLLLGRFGRQPIA